MKPPRGWVLLLFVFALSIRVGGWLSSGGWSDPLASEPTEEVRLAQSLARGDGFVTPYWAPGEYPASPSAHSPPGYPYVLAGLIRVTKAGGLGELAPYRIAILLGCFLGAFAVVMIGLVGFRTHSDFALWATGGVASIWPTLVGGSVLLWDTPFLIFGLAGGLWLVAGVNAPRVNVSNASWLGVVLGILTLFNPLIGPFLALAILIWALGTGWKKAVPLVATAAVICCLCILPWLIRDVRVFHRFIPIRNNFGLELWTGNEPRADGNSSTSMRWHPTDDSAQRAIAGAMGEDAYVQLRGREAKAWIQADPHRFVLLSLKRFELFWFGDLSRQTRVGRFDVPMFGGVNVLKLLLNIGRIGLVLLGMLWWRSRGGRWLAGFGLVALPISYYITHVSPSYRVIVDPTMCLLAGIGLAGVIQYLRPTADSTGRSAQLLSGKLPASQVGSG